MILSASEFTRRLDLDEGPGKLIITPYHKESQQPASYDLRAASDRLLPQGICTLVPTTEWVELPTDLAGTLMCRSSFGRRGVLLGAGYVDPGFRGQLTLCLTNMGGEDIHILKDDRIVQMILHEIREGNHGYAGRYQDSHGAVEAKGS
ncbi:MAG: dCTP deaminase [Methanoregula sp.]|jgi:dCTP deaminase|nr:dCTP deaminase [Methanoregula sp.]